VYESHLDIAQLTLLPNTSTHYSHNNSDSSLSWQPVMHAWLIHDLTLTPKSSHCELNREFESTCKLYVFKSNHYQVKSNLWSC